MIQLLILHWGQVKAFFKVDDVPPANSSIEALAGQGKAQIITGGTSSTKGISGRSKTHGVDGSGVGRGVKGSGRIC